MKLVLATPLYPPDIAEPAPYIKELARRLSATHEVTVVAYGKHPELIEGVQIIAVDKHQPLLARLIAFFFALQKATRGADALIVENGASVELPAGVLARFSRIPLLIHRGDPSAHTRAATHARLRRIERFAEKRAKAVIEERPNARPEILPFEPVPSAEQEAYEASWKAHLGLLNERIHA